MTQISFFTCTYNSFVCIVTLMLRRREKEQEIISLKGHVILLTYTHTHIHTYIRNTQPDLFISQGSITGSDIIIPLTTNGIRSACIIKAKKKEKNARAVYLVVHSDIQYIVKDNDNKLQLFE